MARILVTVSMACLLAVAAGAVMAGQPSGSASAYPGRNVLSAQKRAAASAFDLQSALITDSSALYFYDVSGNGACELTVFGDQNLSELATNMAIGDVNGDGTSDLVVTADLEDVGANLDRGAIYIFFGGPALTSDSISSATANVVILGRSNGETVGYGLALADVNGDDTTDIIVGAHRASPNFNSEGRVYVFFGTNAFPDTVDLLSTSADVEIVGPSIDAGSEQPILGTSIATGDVNGDGLQDVVMHGAGADAPGRLDVSCTWVMLGRSTWQSNYEVTADSLAGFVGEPLGAVIYGVDSNDAYYEIPPMSGSHYISSARIIACGDVNNDNIDDIMIAFPGGNGPNNVGYQRGEVHVVFGFSELGQDTLVTNFYRYTPIDLATASDITIYGQTDADGIQYVHCFDVNNDAIDDIVVPCRFGDGPGEARADCGELSVFYGGALPDSLEAPTDADVYISSRDANDRIETVTFADLNGDTHRELIYGSYRADGPGNTILEGGEVEVFLRPDTLSGVVDLSTDAVDATLFAIHPNELLGVFAGLAAGDVTGDGRDDLIVGSVNGIDTVGFVTGSLYIIDGTKFLSGDSDLDAVDDLCDNCPDIANPNQADSNSNGIGDACESCCVLRGNINGEGDIDVSDVTYLVAYAFKQGPPPLCTEEGNTNGEGEIDVSDVTFLVAYAFKGGPAPPACP